MLNFLIDFSPTSRALAPTGVVSLHRLKRGDVPSTRFCMLILPVGRDKNSSVLGLDTARARRPGPMLCDGGFLRIRKPIQNECVMCGRDFPLSQL